MSLPTVGLFPEQDKIEGQLAQDLSAGLLDEEQRKKKRSVLYVSNLRKSNKLSDNELKSYESALKGETDINQFAENVYASRNVSIQPEAEEVKRGLGSEFANQFIGGVEDVKGLFDGLTAVVADTFGWESLRDASVKDYIEAKKINDEKYAPSVGTIEEAWQALKDREGQDVARYIFGTFGRQVPNLGTMILGGGLTGMVSKYAGKKLIKKQIAEKLITGVMSRETAKRVGQYAAGSMIPIAMGIGEVGTSQIDLQGNITDAGAAWGFGAVIGMLDNALPDEILNGRAKQIVWKSFLKGGLKGLTVEGATEAAQEAILMASEGYIRPDLIPQLMDSAASRMGNAFAAGALTGGFINGTTKALHATLNKNVTRSPEDYIYEFSDGSFGKKDKESRAQWSLSQELFDKMSPLLSIEKEADSDIKAHAAQVVSRSDLPLKHALYDNGIILEEDSIGNKVPKAKTDTLGFAKIIEIAGGVRNFNALVANRMVIADNLDQYTTEQNINQINTALSYFSNLKKQANESFLKEKTAREVRKLTKQFYEGKVTEQELIAKKRELESYEQTKITDAEALKINNEKESLYRELEGLIKTGAERLKTYKTKTGNKRNYSSTVRKTRELIYKIDRLERTLSDDMNIEYVSKLNQILEGTKIGEQIKQERGELTNIINELKSGPTKGELRKYNSLTKKIDKNITSLRKERQALNKRIKRGYNLIGREDKNLMQAFVEATGTNKDMNRADIELTKYLSSLRDFAVDGGLVSKDVAELWQQDLYAPMYRDFGKEFEDLSGPDNAKLGGKDVKSLKKRKGSSYRVINPVESITKLSSDIISKSLKNIADKQTVELYQTHAPESLSVVKPNTRAYKDASHRDNLFFYYDNGKKIHYTIADPLLYRAMSTVNKPVQNAIMRGIKKINQVLRAAITWTPPFRAASFIRDGIQTWIVTPEFSWIPFVDSMKGLVKSLSNSDVYKDYMTSGFAFGSTMGLRDNINKLIIDKNTYNPLKKANQWWHRFGEALENAARVELYDKLIKKGASRMEAGSRAKGLIDFSQSGANPSVQFASQLVIFLNARLVGWNNTTRNIMRNPKSFSIRAFSVAMATVGLYFWNKAEYEDEWDSLTEAEKRNYWHIWIGKGENKQHFRIPKPFELGILLASVPEAALDRTAGKTNNKQIYRQLASMFADSFEIGIPTAIKPYLEYRANYNFYTRRPIVPEYQQRLAKYAQVGLGTSSTAEALGKATNLSPRHIDNIFQGYIGSLWQHVTSVTDSMAQAAFDIPDRKVSRNDIVLFGPLLSRFAPSEIEGGDEFVNRFYDLNTEIQEVVGTMNLYRKTGDIETAMEIMRDNKKLLLKRKLMQKVVRKMSELNSKMFKVLQGDGSETEKREYIEKVKKYRHQLAKFALDN